MDRGMVLTFSLGDTATALAFMPAAGVDDPQPMSGKKGEEDQNANDLNG